MPDAPAPQEPTAEQAAATMASKPYVVLLVIVAAIGVVVSLAAWCFLELVYQITQEVYTHLPHALGYDNGASAVVADSRARDRRRARGAGDHASAG